MPKGIAVCGGLKGREWIARIESVPRQQHADTNSYPYQRSPAQAAEAFGSKRRPGEASLGAGLRTPIRTRKARPYPGLRGRKSVSRRKPKGTSVCTGKSRSSGLLIPAKGKRPWATPEWCANHYTPAA